MTSLNPAGYFKLNWQRARKDLINEFIPGHHKSYENLSYYDLVTTLVDNDGNVCPLPNRDGFRSFALFTEEHLVGRIAQHYELGEVAQGITSIKAPIGTSVRKIMLGDLVHKLREGSKPETIKINPVLVEISGEDRYLSEEVIFAPLFDNRTDKLLMTDPEDALALLAINPQDQARFGIEMVFHLITYRAVPEETEARDAYLKERIEELAFVAPRVPIKRGSATVYCVILNLENAMEETAFIRSYKTFDPWSDILFVNSSLELLTGDLQKVSYDGEHIDTIFTPIVEWQKNIHAQPLPVSKPKNWSQGPRMFV